jgi:integrase/recombinase XerD
MSVTLRKRKNADGSTSLRLDIYNEGLHKIETLKHLKLSKGNTIEERIRNKENLKLAEEICHQRRIELEANNYNIETDNGNRTIVLDWMDNYIKNYDKTDIRNIEGARNRFKTFLEGKKLSRLTFGNLTPLLIEEFISYLESKSIGEGAKSYYGRFRKMISNAYKSRILKENILDFIGKSPKGEAIEKDTLTKEEVQLLLNTPFKNKNKDIKDAFIFACMTGLRWGDVKDLKWKHINIENNQIKKIQNKNKKLVTIHINDTVYALIGKSAPENEELNVFSLPSHNSVTKAIKKWVKEAGIKLKITFHNARHTFGTNLAFNETEGLTITRMMGQSNMAQAKRYIKIANERKEKATNTLNLDLSTYNEKD